MKHVTFIVALLCFTLIYSNNAEAGSFRFGTNQSVRIIEDIPLQGPQGEDLYLGHVVETHYFLLGTYVVDGGYVLGIKGNHESFYPIPDEEKLTLAQKESMLPDPLPTYELTTFDYIIGYSLWLAIAFFALWAGIKSTLNKKNERAA